MRVAPVEATGEAAAAGTATRPTTAWSWRYLSAMGLVAVVYLALPRGGSLPAWVPELVLYIGAGLSAVVAIVIGVRRHRPRPALAWHLFTAGTLSFVIADVVFVVTEELPQRGSFPVVADWLYLASYPFVLAGLLLIIRQRGPGGDRGSLIDALMVAAALGLLAWTFLLLPVGRDHGLSTVTSLVSTVYPVMDLLLLTAAVKLAVDGGRSPALWLLGASLVLALASDTAYSVLQVSGGYQAGGPVDAGWIAWYACWGAAALHPSMAALSEPAPAREQRLGRVRLWLLALASLVAPAIAAGQAALHRPVDVPAFVLGSVVLSLLALARVAGLASQVAAQASERKRLLDGVVRATEEERMRVAGNLHDGPIQRLTGLGYMVELTQGRFDHGELAASRELLGTLEEGIYNEVAALRRVMAELRPPVLDEFGLPAALRDYAADYQERCGIECTVLARPGLRLDPSLETVLYRVAQEALANVAKHSGAARATVMLSVQDGLARLSVRDDGSGFDVRGTTRRLGREHFGLASMRERVEMAGGSLRVSSEQGAGTTVTAAVPLG